MIPHVKTNDGTVTLQLSTGIKIISKISFNYKKIVDKLDTCTEEDILPLLIPPPLPDGIYHLHVKGNILSVIHYTEKGNTVKIISSFKEPNNIQPIFLGTYASIEDIQEDYPEYFI